MVCVLEETTLICSLVRLLSLEDRLIQSHHFAQMTLPPSQIYLGEKAPDRMALLNSVTPLDIAATCFSFKTGSCQEVRQTPTVTGNPSVSLQRIKDIVGRKNTF